MKEKFVVKAIATVYLLLSLILRFGIITTVCITFRVRGAVVLACGVLLRVGRRVWYKFRYSADLRFQLHPLRWTYGLDPIVVLQSLPEYFMPLGDTILVTYPYNGLERCRPATASHCIIDGKFVAVEDIHPDDDVSGDWYIYKKVSPTVRDILISSYALTNLAVQLDEAVVIGIFIVLVDLRRQNNMIWYFCFIVVLPAFLMLHFLPLIWFASKKMGHNELTSNDQDLTAIQKRTLVKNEEIMRTSWAAVEGRPRRLNRARLATSLHMADIVHI